jgi:hypothetical protein
MMKTFLLIFIRESREREREEIEYLIYL